MTYDPKWSENEFNAILLNPSSTDEELCAKLNGRSAESIGNLRAFIHNFHVRGNISGLTKFMTNRLAAGYWTCPRCHSRVEKHGFASGKGWMP